MTTAPIVPKLRARPVHFGTQGRCPCCGKRTEVRLGSTHGAAAQEWVVPGEVLSRIYTAVAERIKGQEDNLYVVDPHPHNPRVRHRLFFVDGGDGLAGPFGPEGLESFLHDNSPDGTALVEVYAVRTTVPALRHILQSPYSTRPEETPESPVDDPADLF